MLESSHNRAAGANDAGASQLRSADRRPLPGEADVDAILDHIVRSTHEVVDRLAEKAAPALRRLTSGSGDSHVSGADLGTSLDSWWKQYGSVIKDHPVAVLAAAVAAGVLINRIRTR